MVVLIVVGVVVGEFVVVVVDVPGLLPSTMISPSSVVTDKSLPSGSEIDGSMIINSAFPFGALLRISKVKFKTTPFSIIF